MTQNNQLRHKCWSKELDEEAERAFMAAKMAHGAMMLDFQVNEIEAEMLIFGGRKSGKAQEHLRIPIKEGHVSSWNALMESLLTAEKG